MIPGPAWPPVVDAITEAARRGTSYGAPGALEVELAARGVRMGPSGGRGRGGCAGPGGRRRGTSYGAPCALEVELAERVVRMVPSVEKVRFVSSGTEATMSALRLPPGGPRR